MRLLRFLSLVFLCASIAHAQSTIPGSGGAAVPVAGPLQLTQDANFSLAYQNVPYSSNVQAIGGKSPYTYTTTGSPPSGITQGSCTGLAATVHCNFSGTPNGTGLSTFTVMVTDSSTPSQVAFLNPQASINVATLSSSVVTPSGASVQINQNLTFTAIGTWSDGRSFNISNIVSWTCATTCGSFAGQVFTAGGSAGSATIKATFNSVVDDGGSGVALTVSTNTPTILTSSLPHAQNGQPYPGSTCLAASGGTPPYTWTTTAGSTFGVTLNANGCLSGNATSAGSNNVTWKVTDNASNSNTSTFNFTSASVSSVSVTPATPTINVNSTVQMQATSNFSDSSTANISQGTTITRLGSSGCGAASGTSATTLVCSGLNIPSNATLLIGVMGCSGTGSESATSSDGGDTVTFPDSSTQGPSGGIYFEGALFYILNPVANASKSITLTWGTSCAYRHGDFAWYNAPSPAIDQHALGETNASTTLGTSCGSASFTTTSASELIFSNCINGATNRTFTAGNNYTLIEAQAGGQSAIEDQIVSSIQTSIKSAMTFSGSNDNHIGLTDTFSSTGTGAAWSITSGNCTVTASGLVTANSGTSCVVQATYLTISGTQTITINSPVLTSIAVTPSPSSATVGGSTLQLTATATYSDSSTQNVTTTAAWNSSNPSIATVNASGLVTPVAAGSATISAAIGSISGNSALTVNGSGTFQTFFRSDFEGNPTPNPCTLTVAPNSNVGPGDVGVWNTLNANDNSCADTRHTDVSGHTGVAHGGFASALDFAGTGSTGVFPELDGTLTNGGTTAPMWLRFWVYFASTWVDCSGASQPCNNGAQHMVRWWNNDGAHPAFLFGLPVQGDTFQMATTCGTGSSVYCTAGGNVDQEVSVTTSFRISTHSGAWHCVEIYMQPNSPGKSDGIVQWYVDSTLDGNYGGFNLYGTHVFDGLPLISLGSNIGGPTGGTGYPLNSNYFYIDDVAATNVRTGCSIP